MHFFLLSISSLFLIFLLPSIVSAYDLGCQEVWDHPSPNNSMVECAKLILKNRTGLLAPPAAPIIFFTLLLILFPVFFFCRCICGCCGSNRQRPGTGLCGGGEAWDDVPIEYKEKMYPPGHIKCVKCSVVLLFIFSISSIVLIPIGSTRSVKDWDYISKRSKTEIFDYADRRIEEFQKLSQNGTDAKGNPVYVQPIKEHQFTMAKHYISDLKTNFAHIDEKVNFFESIAFVVYILAAVPSLLLFLIILFFIFNVNGTLLTVLNWFIWLIALITALFFSIFSVLSLLNILVCGEVKLQQKMLPGAFQWYIVPNCESHSDIAEMQQNFFDAQANLSVNACLIILDKCDDNPAFEILNPNKVFYCPDLMKNGSLKRCEDIKFVEKVMNTTKVKQGLQICNQCSIFECADVCTDSRAKEPAKKLIETLNIGGKLITGLTGILTDTNCDTIFSRIVEPLDKCEEINVSMFFLTFGFGNAAICLALATILNFKGQKLFFAETPKY